MPQLDKFTFFDQSLTLLIFFLLIYVLSLYFFLPKVLFIIRFRNRFFTVFKQRFSFFSQLLFGKTNKLRIFSRRIFTSFYFFSNFVLLEIREWIRLVRLFNLSFKF